MNIVVILKNDLNLVNKGINIKELKKEYQDLIPGTKISLFDDSIRMNQINSEFSDGFIINNDFYIVLHESVQDENVRQDYIEKYGTNVIRESHLAGGFFMTIIPKLIDSNCTFEDIKKFFPDRILEMRLTLLHKLLGGSFDLNETEIAILKQNEFDLAAYKAGFESSPDWDSLRKLRDQITLSI